MASEQLNTVVAHMRRIALMSATSGAHALHKRALLDMYFAAAPEILTIEAQILPTLVGELTAEWLIPQQCNSKRRLLYLHGGSWMAGSSSSHRPLVARIAKLTGCAVLAINYRLAPEFPFPAGLEDAIHAFQWLQGHGPEDDSEADALFIAGDSAGGNLALAATLALKQGGNVMPDACVVFSPATDLNYERSVVAERAERDPILIAAALPYVVANYVQEQANHKDPLVSPIHGDLSGLPPTLLQVGDAEILYDDGVRFVQAAQQQGSPVELSEWPDMPHVFQGFAPLLPEANQALAEVQAFIARFG
ncbi:alpha/beta hydrolase [Halioxenophilus aromaticivorans]|uniref:Alpha/beta hydrolase n=1 Tax=Halioxenophilus aromaticivorans TaxID=1306992 RepID=A0AAV3U6N4_9ALTE